nr:MAG: hypothetical protein [Erinaceus hedgehog coronavirus HKU31]
MPHLVMSMFNLTNLMNYISLLNQVWQKYNSTINSAEQWTHPPQYIFHPVLGESPNTIQWLCTATFLGNKVQAVSNTKALAKQQAAKQLIQIITDGV